MSDVYRIRPLEWIPKDEGCDVSRPFPGFAYYLGRERGGFAIGCCSPDDSHIKPCDSIEHGKQLAEAHWRQRLQSVLEPVEDES